MQLVRQRAAEDDAVTAASEVLQAARHQVLGEAGGGALLLRQHSAHVGPRHGRAVRKHRLALDVGHRGLHAALPAHHGLHRTPVGQCAVEPRDGGVGCDREDAVAQLALEAVHDREHDDQRGDPEHQAAHRHEGDERDEAAPMRRAQVARADQPLVGAHTVTRTAAPRRARYAPRGSPGRRSRWRSAAVLPERSPRCCASAPRREWRLCSRRPRP